MGDNDDEMIDDVFDEMEKRRECVFRLLGRRRPVRAVNANGAGLRLFGVERSSTGDIRGWSERRVRYSRRSAVAQTTRVVLTEASDDQEHVYDLRDRLYEPENAVDLSITHNYPMAMKRLSDGHGESVGRAHLAVPVRRGPREPLWIDWDEMIPNMDRITERVSEVMAS